MTVLLLLWQIKHISARDTVYVKYLQQNTCHLDLILSHIVGW